MEPMTPTVNDLVMLRLPNDPTYTGRQRHYNTWFRVVYVDDDGFIGIVERTNHDFELHKKGDHVGGLDPDKIQHIYKEGEQFCYSDNVTVCSCKGLCLDK